MTMNDGADVDDHDLFFIQHQNSQLFIESLSSVFFFVCVCVSPPSALSKSFRIANFITSTVEYFVGVYDYRSSSHNFSAENNNEKHYIILTFYLTHGKKSSNDVFDKILIIIINIEQHHIITRNVKGKIKCKKRKIMRHSHSKEEKEEKYVSASAAKSFLRIMIYHNVRILLLLSAIFFFWIYDEVCTLYMPRTFYNCFLTLNDIVNRVVSLRHLNGILFLKIQILFSRNNVSMHFMFQ